MVMNVFRYQVMIVKILIIFYMLQFISANDNCPNICPNMQFKLCYHLINRNVDYTNANKTSIMLSPVESLFPQIYNFGI